MLAPCLSFHPRHITIYKSKLKNSDPKPRYWSKKPTPEELEEMGMIPPPAKETGLLSHRVKKRIQAAIQVLHYCSEDKRAYSRKYKTASTFKLNFLTLTLPTKQIHSDKEIHEKCFKPFIKRLTTLFPKLMYVYRVECQQNGNLHYHIVGNQFIHMSDLQAYWNHYIDKLGYVERYEGKNPPSTNIQSTKGINDLAAYLCKYLSKNSGKDRRVPDIKEWGCSIALRQFKIPPIVNIPEEIKEEIKAIHTKLRSTVKYDYCYLIKMSLFKINDVAPRIYDLYCKAIYNVLHYNRYGKGSVSQ